MEKKVAFAFPTPIGRFMVPAPQGVNQELKRLILDREKVEPSRVYSNAGGWHSGQDLFEWPSPAVATLRGWVFEAIQHMVATTVEMMKASMPANPTKGSLQVKAWANVSRVGNYHRLHNHPGAAWSGVYYVETGGDAPGYPLSGLLELLDPRPFTEMVSTPGDPFGQKAIFKPEPGMMVIFPSWLYHFVNPFFGEGERISVAFNAHPIPEPQAG